MFELLAESLKALAAYPPLAALAGLSIIIGAGIWLFLRGERNRKTNGNGQSVPTWTLYGPAHDAIGAIHDIAEQSRRQTDLLVRIEDHQRQIAETTRNNAAIMEMIRNESRLR